MAESQNRQLSSPQFLPPFAALRAFEAVFRTGGIRRASAHLGISHAVISRHLKQLEDWLGEPLVTKAGNRLALTEDGAAFHARVSYALGEIALATREFQGHHDHGLLKVWCVPGLAIQWLAGQLAEFERRHPEFSVELKPSDVPANLLAHEAHGDIRFFRLGDPAPPAPKGIRSFELSRPPILAVASPDVAHRLNRATILSALLSETLLHEENDWEWRAWLASNGIEVPGKLPGQLCWHAHLAIAAARLGRGVALASHHLVASDLDRGDLVEVAFAGSHRVVLGSYILLAREDRWSHPSLYALRGFLREQAARERASETSCEAALCGAG